MDKLASSLSFQFLISNKASTSLTRQSKLSALGTRLLVQTQAKISFARENFTSKEEEDEKGHSATETLEFMEGNGSSAVNCEIRAIGVSLSRAAAHCVLSPSTNTEGHVIIRGTSRQRRGNRAAV